jgi:hypothetical protein
MATMPDDWIKLFRRIKHSSVACDEGLFATWTMLLVSVNWRKGWFKMHRIEPGQMAFSWRSLPQRLYPQMVKPPSVNTLRRRFTQLQHLGMISVQTIGGNFSVVTICNWRTYQEGVATIDTLADTPVDTVADTLVDTLADTKCIKAVDTDIRKEGKKGKKEETPLPPLPPDLDVPEFRESLTAWLESHKPYRPAGLKALVTRAAKRAETHGVDGVCSAMQQAMSNGYQGWDKDYLFPPEKAIAASRLPTAEDDATWAQRAGVA